MSTKPSQEHKPFQAAVIIFTVLVYAGTMVISALNSIDGIETGIFLNSTGDLARKYYSEVTPSSFVFAIVWTTIYVWLALVLLYGLTTLCRKGPSGGYLYISPSLTPSPVYIFIVLNLCCNVSWSIMWDREYIDFCLIPISLLAFSLYCAIFASARNLFKYHQDFVKSGCGKELWIVRILVHNCLAFYATWSSIATLLNMAAVLTYRAGVDMPLSNTIALSALAVEAIAWFILDIFVWDKYVRYMFTPYVVTSFALFGSVYKNWNPPATNSIFTAALLGVVAILTFIKLITMIWRHRSRPLSGYLV